MIPEPGFQKPMPYARRNGAQEVVHLGVGVDRHREVGLGADAGLDQVVAVHRRGHRDLREPGSHELQQRHLRGGVLHGDTVGAEFGVRDTAGEVLVLRVGEVVDEDLLGQRQGAPEPAAGQLDALVQPCVDLVDQLDGGSRFNRHALAP